MFEYLAFSHLSFQFCYHDICEKYNYEVHEKINIIASREVILTDLRTNMERSSLNTSVKEKRRRTHFNYPFESSFPDDPLTSCQAWYRSCD